MNWEKDVVWRTLEGAAEYPYVQLLMLLMRPKAYPEALPAIANSIRDMGEWYANQSDELKAKKLRRFSGAEAVTLKK